MVTMTFTEFDSKTLEWKTILKFQFPNFEKALNASDEVWKNLLPFAKRGRRFHCIFGNL